MSQSLEIGYASLMNYKFTYNGELLSMEDLMNQWFFGFTDQAHYDKWLAGIMSWRDTVGVAGVKGADCRVLVTISDGTVGLDTAKTNNSYANYKAKVINENHNTRAAIMQSLLSGNGKGFETKISSTNRRFETYSSTRYGPTVSRAYGVVRVSMVAPSDWSI